LLDGPTGSATEIEQQWTKEQEQTLLEQEKNAEKTAKAKRFR